MTQLRNIKARLSISGAWLKPKLSTAAEAAALMPGVAHGAGGRSTASHHHPSCPCRIGGKRGLPGWQVMGGEKDQALGPPSWDTWRGDMGVKATICLLRI